MPLSNQNYMDALLAKLYATLAPVNIADPNSELPFVAFTRAGVPLSADDLNFGFLSADMASETRAYRFAAIADAIPALTGLTWMPTGKLVPDVYERVLRDKQLPLVTLTPQERDLLQKATDYLHVEIKRANPFTGEVRTEYADTPYYTKYQELKAELALKETEWRSSYYHAMISPADTEAKLNHKIRGPLLQAQADAIRQKIKANNGEYIEQAIGIIADLGGKGPSWYWDMLMTRYQKAERKTEDDQAFRFTDVFPSRFWGPEHADSWTKFSFSHSEAHVIDTSSRSSWGGGASVSFGLWSFGAAVSRESVRTEHTADTENTSVSLEAVTIPLRRSWLDAGVFWSPSWRFHPDYAGDQVSDGAGNGLMPAYPTALLICRNLQLKTGNTHTHDSYAYDKVTSSGSVGWGPFSIRGNYTKETTSKTHDFVENAAGISCPGMQIFGVICQRVPKSPNPSPALNWPHNP